MRVTPPRLLLDLGDAYALDPRRRPGEVAVDELLVESDSLEYLGPPVALDGRNAHLGHYLEDALVQGLDVVLFCVVATDRLDESGLVLHVGQRLVGQVRVDCGGAVSYEEGELGYVPRLARLHDQSGAGPDPFTDHVVMYAGHRQEAWDRRVTPVYTPVGQDEDGAVVRDGCRGLIAYPVHGLLERARSESGLEERGNGPGANPLGVEPLDLLQLAIAEDGAPYSQLPAVLGCLVEQVLLRPDRHVQRCDKLLADRVQRGIADLCEQLLEVAEEERGVVRQDRQRGVVPHGAYGLGAIDGHWLHEHPQVFKGIAECGLPLSQGVEVGTRHARRLRQPVQIDRVLLQPAAIGLLGGELGLDLFVTYEAALVPIEQEHATRVYAVLEQDVLRRDVQDAGLRCHDEQIVGCDQVPAGAKTVSVEYGADLPAIGADNERGPVPWLHEG